LDTTWIPIIGKFDIAKDGITFIPDDVSSDGKALGAVPPSGIAISNQSFSGGAVACEVQFEANPADSLCQIVFSYEPSTRHYIAAGFGYGTFCSIWQHAQKPQYYSAVGDASNLEAGRRYKLRLALYGSRVTLYIDDVGVTSADIPIALKRSQVGMSFASRDRITVSNFKVDAEQPTAFVVMQFTEPYNQLYSEVIKAVCSEYNLNAVRADDSFGPGLIVADVANQIADSDLIIAEITPNNPNVYYEVGYAHALNKPTILIAEKSTKLPFDVSPFRTLFYENTINGKARIEEGLRKHVGSILSSARA
jgi:hypothetical protein